MKRPLVPFTTGIMLVAVGVVLLMQNLGLFGDAEDVVMALIFGGCGVGFLGLFASRRDAWWAAIPSFALLGIAALIGSTALGIEPGPWGGALFLGGLGLGFVATYLRRNQNWWAIIPGGVLLTLALVAGLSETVPDEEIGSIFFFGLALTFAAVYLQARPRGRATWALFPAAGTALMGLVILANVVHVINLIWPALMIVAGLALLAGTLRGRAADFGTSEQEQKEGTYEPETLPQPH